MLINCLLVILSNLLAHLPASSSSACLPLPFLRNLQSFFACSWTRKWTLHCYPIGPRSDCHHLWTLYLSNGKYVDQELNIQMVFGSWVRFSAFSTENGLFKSMDPAGSVPALSSSAQESVPKSKRMKNLRCHRRPAPTLHPGGASPNHP